MKAVISVFFIAVLAITFFATGSARSAGWVYWTEPDLDKIQGAEYDGSGLRDVIASLGDPRDIELDMVAMKLYWTNTATSAIRRCDFDGSNAEDVILAAEIPSGIALDVTGGKIYWTEGTTAGTAAIKRADLDGSNIETLVAPFPRLRDPYDIDLDVAGGKMYWTDHGMGRVYRANLDGSSIDTLWAGAVDPRGIAVDPGNGKYYYADESGGIIMRANLNGTGLQGLISGAGPHALDLDLADGKIYWTDVWWDYVYRADLDGSNQETIITGLDNPVGLAVDPSGTSPVLLRHFTAAARTPGGVELTWQVTGAGAGMEFHVMREVTGRPGYREPGDVSVTNVGVTYRAVDRGCEPGVSYRYRVDVSDENGRRALFETQTIEVPGFKLELGQNQPNPFNPSTAIPFTLPRSERVKLAVYDVNGKLVKTLIDGVMEAGVTQARWDGRHRHGNPASSGVYFCRLQVGKKFVTRTMVLLR